MENGDIIKLKDGRMAKITLEIFEPIIELIPGKVYELKHNGQFCYIVNGNSDTNKISYKNQLKNTNWIYVGEINIPIGKRAIFISENHYSTYTMFSNKTLSFVIREIK